MIKIIIISLFIFQPTFAITEKLWNGVLMNSKEVCNRWGGKKFDLKMFKSSMDNKKLRASMACSLLKNQKKFVGKSRTDIRQLFGDPDGFYFSDIFPAFIIEKGKNKEENTWQILFMLNEKYKVSKIVVHRACCDR